MRAKKVFACRKLSANSAANNGEVMELSRRDLLYKCMALAVVKLGAGMSPALAVEAWLRAEKMTRQATPIDQLGPFYKKGAPNTAVLRSAGDPGLALAVAGAVYNTRGEELPGAKIEIWQTNHQGHYDLSGYRYRAALVAGAKGLYEFQSVIPGHYPARACQHIHFLVTAPGQKPLVTQMYFGSDPVFKGDPAKNPNDDCPSVELVRPILLTDQADTMSASARFELVMEAL
jgi:protocatechuate 3,4-dioxygenase beta subunit